MADEARLSWDQVRAFRLRRQHLVERAPLESRSAVVASVCGIHAQVQSAAELQFWARLEGVRRDDIRDALWQQRSLVRTWCMRGTLHLLSAEDLPLYVAALRTHDRWWKGAWLKMIGLNATELNTILEAIRSSLGADPITREELADRVAAQTGAAAREGMLSGWAEMLKPAAFAGSLISGPPRGQSVTFVRPDRWLGQWTEPDAATAWPEIVRRYLRAYGPASREEFARWWGMQPATAGRILRGSSAELAEVGVEGYRAWILAEDLGSLRAAPAAMPLRLLPAFDVYVAATRPRASLVAERYEERVFRTAGWVSPVVVVAGMIAGIWSHERVQGRIQVSVEPFAKLSDEHKREIVREADRLGEFLDAPATVSFSAA